MKKHIILLILFFSIAVTGCALRDYYDACKNDPACVEKVSAIEDRTETVVSTGVALIPHPAAQVSAGVAGKATAWFAGIVAAIILGRAKKKATV